MSKETFDSRAALVKSIVLKAEGKEAGTLPMPIKGHTEESYAQAVNDILDDLPTAVKQLGALRKGGKQGTVALDISLAEYAKKRWGFSISNSGAPDAFFEALGVDTRSATIESLYTMPDNPDGYRWLVPEVIREAVKLGVDRNPVYASLIAAEESISQPQQIMPHINKSRAIPQNLREGETIPVGKVSFGQKTVKINKVGVGLEMTDEVIQYVPLNILAIYLGDVGLNMNLALDTQAIDVLINGDQDGGTEAAATIGVTTATQWEYRDLLRVWIRMSRLGRMPNAIIAGEEPAMDILELPEFKGFAGESTKEQIRLRTPVPATQDFHIHGSMTDPDQIMFVDSSAALIKLNATALRVESERIVDRQINGTYVTQTTGFAGMFRDARVIVDKGIAYSGNGWPAWMDIDLEENTAFDD